MTNVMKKLTLKITDMHCTSCSVLIDTVLEELPGVKSSKTSYADSKTEVEFEEDKVSLDQLLTAIKSEGYTANT